MRSLKTAGLVLVFVVLCAPAFAQATGPGAGAPIDGGLSLLLAAGIGYGAKKIHDSRKQKKETASRD